MRNKTKLFMITLAIFSFLFGFNSKSSAEVKIALVDMVQVVKNYGKAQKAQADLQVNQKEINKMIAKAREEVKKIKEAEVKDQKEKKLAEEILTKSKTYREIFSKKWQQVQSDILLTIKKVADDGKYDLVMDKQTVIAGGEDITKKVLAELEK